MNFRKCTNIIVRSTPFFLKSEGIHSLVLYEVIKRNFFPSEFLGRFVCKHIFIKHFNLAKSINNF